ncbi:MAG: sec-independent translocase [Actinomycetota bacterium]|nr:sec-independent translocase [Actinomycetota bacterium]
MFNSLGWPEIALLVVIALFVFGPERLPTMAAEAGRMLRTLRQMANNARSDLQAELGPELGDLDLASLNPKTFIRKNLFDDEDLLSDTPPAVVRQHGRAVSRPLAEGERAPYDDDAT